jgi:hypothetical protein
MPTAIDGYTPYQGPVHQTIRVFKGGLVVIPSEFRSQMNHCATAMWTARWRTLTIGISVWAMHRTFDGNPIGGPPELAAGAEGNISGSICQRPGFTFAFESSVSGFAYTDVDIEWQYWDA